MHAALALGLEFIQTALVRNIVSYWYGGKTSIFSRSARIAYDLSLRGQFYACRCHRAITNSHIGLKAASCSISASPSDC